MKSPNTIPSSVPNFITHKADKVFKNNHHKCMKRKLKITHIHKIQVKTPQHTTTRIPSSTTSTSPFFVTPQK